jgi:hypothetical protein
MVTLEGLQGHLLRGLELVGLELLHFASKHSLSGHGRVNTVRLIKGTQMLAQMATTIFPMHCIQTIHQKYMT